MRLLKIDAICDAACVRLEKEQESIERSLTRATDPKAKSDLEQAIVRIEANRAEAFAARDKMYEALAVEPLQGTEASDHVTRKRHRFRFWKNGFGSSSSTTAVYRRFDPDRY
jgi:hypothetical protein